MSEDLMYCCANRFLFVSDQRTTKEPKSALTKWEKRTTNALRRSKITHILKLTTANTSDHQNQKGFPEQWWDSRPLFCSIPCWTTISNSIQPSLPRNNYIAQTLCYLTLCITPPWPWVLSLVAGRVVPTQCISLKLSSLAYRPILRQKNSIQMVTLFKWQQQTPKLNASSTMSWTRASLSMPKQQFRRRHFHVRRCANPTLHHIVWLVFHVQTIFLSAMHYTLRMCFTIKRESFATVGWTERWKNTGYRDWETRWVRLKVDCRRHRWSQAKLHWSTQANPTAAKCAATTILQTNGA